MRRVSITPIAAGAVVTGFVSFVLSLLWALVLSLVLSLLCFTLISVALGSLINLVRVSALGVVVPPMAPGELMTGDFLTDIIAAFIRPAQIWSLLLVGLVAVLGLALEGRLAQLRHGRLRLALFAAYAIAFAVIVGPGGYTNIQSFIVSVLMFPLVLINSVVPPAFMNGLGAAVGAESPIYYGLTIGGSIAVSLVGVRILADMIVFLVGLASSGDFRTMVWRSLLHPPVRSRASRVLPPRSALWRIARPILVALGLGCVVWLAYAGAIYLFTRLEDVPPLLALLRLFAPWQILPDMWLPALACLPALIAGLAGYPIARLSGRRSGLFAEWIIASAVLLAVLWLFQAGIGGLTTETRNSWLIGFTFAIPAILVALAQRRLLWTGLREALGHWQAATQVEVEAQTYARLNPVLYLRAFMDDRLSMSGRFSAVDILMGRAQRGLRFEEVIAQRAFNWRPIVALGNPHLPFQLAGALKRLVHDDGWKQEVELWNSHAAYVLMIGNKTDNIGWEIELIKSSGAAHRAIYVVTQRQSAADFFSHYGLLGDADPRELPPTTLVVFHDPERGWTAVTSALKTYTAYAVAIDIAIAATEHRHRTEAKGALPLPAGA